MAKLPSKPKQVRRIQREVPIDSKLRDVAYERLLKRTRRHLNPTERPISAFIHQPAVNTITEALERSIGRSSGILMGGLAGLTGSLAYYFFARHYGYDYNFSVFPLLMVGGFIMGWLLEFLWRLIKILFKK
jgi:hypothetical protein